MSHEPTIVLVHGAFADASSWDGVVERLLQGGHHVVAPANPLRGVAADSAYLASYISQIDGPTILVGHSYGGAVISNAATTAKNVLALVFVAAYAPEKGETLGGAGANSKDSVLNSALVQRLYPTGKDGETAPEFIVDPAKFHDAFAADVPDRQSAVMAVTQRPIAAGAFSEASGPQAWKTIPSWAVVAVGDKAAGTDVHSFDGQESRRQDGRDQGFARDHGFATAGGNRCDPRGTPGRGEASGRRRGAK
jgi:pimeloyl-ACP methyl ester carboxylesterase